MPEAPAGSGGETKIPTRVLLVTGPCAGGIRRYLLDLVARLPSRGWEPLVAAPPGIEGLEPDLPLAAGSSPTTIRRWADTLACGAGDTGAALIHAHGLKAAVACLLRRRRHRAPVLVTLHNLARSELEALLVRCLLRRATAVSCVSDAVGRSYALLRWERTPPGVDLERFRPPEPAGDPPLAVLFAGRLTREKGADLLPAIASMLPAELALPILVAGEGPLDAGLRRAAGLNPRLHLLGQVERIEDVYARAAFLLAPSRREGFGLSALEAMACGLPVVGARAGGLSDLVADGATGFLSTPGDAAALARSLARAAAMGGAERHAMGAAARARAEQFGLDGSIDRICALYTRVTAAN
jgi:glycosyltransferase involved in cell wall biosynthesis